MSDKFTIGLTVETSTSFEIILWEFNPGLFPCNVVYGQNRPRAFVNSVLKIFEKYRYGGEEVEDERDAKLYRIMWSSCKPFLTDEEGVGDMPYRHNASLQVSSNPAFPQRPHGRHL